MLNIAGRWARVAVTKKDAQRTSRATELLGVGGRGLQNSDGEFCVRGDRYFELAKINQNSCHELSSPLALAIGAGLLAAEAVDRTDRCAGLRAGIDVTVARGAEETFEVKDVGAAA